MPFFSPEFHAGSCVQGTDFQRISIFSYQKVIGAIKHKEAPWELIISGDLSLTQEKEGNANSCHCYTKPGEEMVAWHIRHTKNGLCFHVSYVVCSVEGFEGFLIEA